MAGINGDVLYSIITGDQDIQSKEQTLSDLKAHVKKELVLVLDISKYTESLLYVLDKTGNDWLRLRSLAFSTLCHLLKRIALQDNHLLFSYYEDILPHLIPEVSSEKEATRYAASRLVWLYWMNCPNEVESVIKEGLVSDDLDLVNNSLHALLLIVDSIQNESQPKSFLFKPFTSIVVSFLKNDVPSSIQNLAYSLLISFFKNCASKTAKQDLVNELMKQSVGKNIVNSLMLEIDPNLANYYNQLSYQTSTEDISSKFLNSGSVKISAPQYHSLNKTKSVQGLRPRQGFDKQTKPWESERDNSTLHSLSSSTSFTHHSKIDQVLASFLQAIPGYHFEHVNATNVPSASNLRDIIEEMLPSFLGKETEFNWTLRERNVMQLRSILMGNTPQDFPEDLGQCLRTFCDAITKAVSSLRTSLSSYGCQLIREMAMVVLQHMDSVTIDVCATTLLKLSSSAKRIASQNAMVAFSTLVAHVPFHTRVFNQIISASQDKNTQPRLYSATWIQIYIMKNHDYLKQANGGIALEQLERAILKCLNDPNANVRESMRSSFWCFYKYWPTIAEKSLSKLDLTTTKLLNRSRPSSVSLSVDAIPRSPKKRQSIRELIVAKNRSTPSSVVQSQTNTHRAPVTRVSNNSGADLGKPVRVNTAHRAKRIPSTKISSLAAAGVVSRSRSEDLDMLRSRDSAELSTRDIFTRAPSVNTSEIASRNLTPEVVETQDQSLSKPNEEDMILSALKSDILEERADGISMLKYAFISKEEIVKEIPPLLASLSINDPKILRPLYDLDLLNESLKHISAENFLRSFIICYIDNDSQLDIKINNNLVTTLVDAMSVDDLYGSCAQLMNTLNNVSLVVNANLAMQLLKYKNQFFLFVISLLVTTLQSFPISDVSFAKLADVLFQSLDFFMASEDSEEFSNYENLLIMLRDINSSLFQRSLGSQGETVADTVKSLLGMNLKSKEISEDVEMVDSDHNSLYEMTMIKPGSKSKNITESFDIHNPLNDLTMIMPKFSRSRSPPSLSEKENIMEEDDDDDSIFHHHGLNFQKAEKEVYEQHDHDVHDSDKADDEVSDNEIKYHENDHDMGTTEQQDIDHETMETGLTKVDGLTNYDTTYSNREPETTTVVIPHYSQEDEAHVSDIGDENMEQTSSPSSSHELITQIENVNITSPIDSMLSKSDPLLSLALDKSIHIYTDEKKENHNSDSFAELNSSANSNEEADSWFGFQQQKYFSLDARSVLKRTSLVLLKAKCLSGDGSDNDWLHFMTVIFQSDEVIMQMDEVIQLIDKLKPDSKEMLYVLAILINNLLRDLVIDLDGLTMVCDLLFLKISMHCKYYANELWFAVSDVMHEIVRRNYNLALERATFQLDEPLQRIMALAAVQIVVEQQLNNLTKSQIQNVASFCTSLLGDDEAVVRRYCIMILATLSQLNDEDSYLVYDEHLKLLTPLQYKLVELFAMSNN